MSALELEIVNNLLDHYIEKNDWKEARCLLTTSETPPDKQHIASLFEKAALCGQMDLVKMLCELPSDNQPDQPVVSNVLKKMLDQEMWPVVRYLCSLQTKNQPDKDAVCQVLHRAAMKKYWLIVTQLCNMQGDNKPRDVAMAFAFDRVALWGITNLITMLSSLDIKGPPIAANDGLLIDSPSDVPLAQSLQNSANKALGIAVNIGSWRAAGILCAMTSEQKPDKTSIAFALQQAASLGKIDFVAMVCHLKTDNQPDQAAVSMALKLAADKKMWGVVNYFVSLSIKNKPAVEALTYALEKQQLQLDKEREATEHRERAEVERKAREEAECRERAEVERKAREEAECRERAEVERQTREEAERKYEEEQQQQRQQDEKCKVHQQFIKTVMLGIDDVMHAFEEKIHFAEYHSDDAYQKTVELLSHLKNAQKNYEAQLYQPNISITEANFAFKKQCKALIEDAIPVLERDLGWGDYLVNFLIAISNATIRAVSFGHVSAFFKPVRAQSLQVAEDMERVLESLP